MKNILVLLCTLFLVACSSDQKSKTELSVKPAVKAMNAEVKSETSPTQKAEQKIEDVTTAVHEELKSTTSLDQKQKEIKKEQFEKSVNKEKSCSDLIVEYDKLIDRISKDKTNVENLNKLRSWANDIFHNTCLKDNTEYQSKYAEINKKLG